MKRNALPTRLATMFAGGILSLAGIASTGCQVDVAGQTLPSPYFLQDDIQFFPAGPEFKLSNEAAALKAFHEEAGALAIMPDHLDEIAASSAKDEQVAAMRIFFERLLDEQRKPRKALAHVRVAWRQPHPNTLRNRQH